MAAADETKMSKVHDALADWCLACLSARDPETGRYLLTASEAAVIRAFLKDNDITASADEGTKIGDLKKKLAARRGIPPAPVNPLLDLGDTEGTMQ